MNTLSLILLQSELLLGSKSYTLLNFQTLWDEHVETASRAKAIHKPNILLKKKKGKKEKKKDTKHLSLKRLCF